MNGYADKPPTLPPLALADMIAGLYGASAVLAALRGVEQGGARPGDRPVAVRADPLADRRGGGSASSVTGMATMRAGNQSSHTAPRNVYACADGTYVAMSGSMQSMAERILDTIGRSELKTRSAFCRPTRRASATTTSSTRMIGGFVGARTQDENLALFEAAGVTVGAGLLDRGSLVDHPYVAGREALVELPDAEMGSVPMPNVIPRFSRMQAALSQARAEAGRAWRRDQARIRHGSETTVMTSHAGSWRSMLFIPVLNERFLAKAVERGADAIQLDLEDAIPQAQKDEARRATPAAAERLARQGLDVVVRINRPWRQALADIEASVGPHVCCLTLPKVPDASHVRAIAEVLDEARGRARPAASATRGSSR